MAETVIAKMQDWYQRCSNSSTLPASICTVLALPSSDGATRPVSHFLATTLAAMMDNMEHHTRVATIDDPWPSWVATAVRYGSTGAAVPAARALSNYLASEMPGIWPDNAGSVAALMYWMNVASEALSARLDKEQTDKELLDHALQSIKFRAWQSGAPYDLPVVSLANEQAADVAHCCWTGEQGTACEVCRGAEPSA